MLFQVAKDLEGGPDLNGRIMLKTWPGYILKFHQQNCHALQKIKMLGDLNSSCLPHNPKRTTGQRKIQQTNPMFSFKNNNDDDDDDDIKKQTTEGPF